MLLIGSTLFAVPHRDHIIKCAVGVSVPCSRPACGVNRDIRCDHVKTIRDGIGRLACDNGSCASMSSDNNDDFCLVGAGSDISPDSTGTFSTLQSLVAFLHGSTSSRTTKGVVFSGSVSINHITAVVNHTIAVSNIRFNRIFRAKLLNIKKVVSNGNINRLSTLALHG